MPPPNSNTTISTDYATPLLKDLKRLGSDVENLWRQGAIQTPLYSVLKDDAQSLPATEFTRLYRACMEELEQRCCARDERRPMGKLAVNMLCYCVISCPTLSKVIERVIEFNAMMKERGGNIRLDVEGDLAYFTMHVPGRHRDTAALLVDLTGLYFYFQLFSWLLGCQLPLHSVGVAYAAPATSHPLLEVFGIPLNYEQPANQLSFPARYLSQRTVRSYTELEKIIDYFPFDLSLGQTSQPMCSLRVRLLLLDTIQRQHEIPVLDTVAQLFHMSSATLRRRLKEEGTAYGEIRAICQREIAEYLLSATDQPVEDIALYIGFGSDRAFHEWTGRTPTHFRRAQQQVEK